MSPDQRARALRLADALDELDSAFSATGVCGEAADLLRELAAEPRKRTEEDAFEDWLEKECPSGDVDEVQRKWEASEALAELLDEQRKQAEQDLLLDLLAVLHRDGGHHTDAVGLAQSIEDAKARYYALCDEPVRVPLTDELAVSPQEVTEALRFVRTHLYAAQAQASPGDDSIIMRHVYDAYRRIADLTKEVELHGITGDAK